MCRPEGDARGTDLGAVDVVTGSRWSRDGLLAVGFEEQQIHTEQVGLDPLLFGAPAPCLREQLRGGLQPQDDVVIFLNVSNLMWNKAIGPLIAAFARHRLRNENAVLVLKGGDTLYGSDNQAGVAEAQT